jgi:hypothetical protein
MKQLQQSTLCVWALLFVSLTAWTTGAEPSLTYQELHRQFLHPGPAYRGKPFWSWNGELEEDEPIRQIRVMKAMGFGGFSMHLRTGLATEYLGQEWFDLTHACRFTRPRFNSGSTQSAERKVASASSSGFGI